MKFFFIAFGCMFFLTLSAQTPNSPTVKTFESKRIIFSKEHELFYLKGYDLMKKSNHDITKIVLTPVVFDSIRIYNWHNIELIDSFIFTIGYYNYGATIVQPPPGGAGIVHFYNFECKKHNRIFKNNWDWYMPGGSSLRLPDRQALKFFRKERFSYDFVTQDKQFYLLTILADTLTVYRSLDNMTRLPGNQFEIHKKIALKKLHQEYFVAIANQKTGDIDIYFDTQGTYKLNLKRKKKSRLITWLFGDKRFVKKDKVNHRDDFYFYDRVEDKVYIINRKAAEQLVETKDVEKAVRYVRQSERGYDN